MDLGGHIAPGLGLGDGCRHSNRGDRCGKRQLLLPLGLPSNGRPRGLRVIPLEIGPDELQILFELPAPVLVALGQRLEPSVLLQNTGPSLAILQTAAEQLQQPLVAGLIPDLEAELGRVSKPDFLACVARGSNRES